MRQLSPYLPREALSSMNPQQIEYAKEQLHLLLSQQMSKVSMGLSKKEKVQNNLLELQKRQERLTNTRIQKLNDKFSNTEEKRKKVLEDKIAQCKLHDKKLQNKVSQMTRKKNQQERQAAKKSRTYSLDLFNYLKRKQLGQQQIQNKIKKQFQHKQKQQNMNESLFNQPSPSLRQNNQTIKPLFNRLSSTALDQSIRKHQKKAKIQHQQSTQATFQKILKKMDMMNQKKLIKFIKNKQLKETNKTTESRMNNISDLYHSRDYKSKQPTSNSNNFQYSQNRMNKKTIDYISIKRQKQQREFEQRGQIYNRMKQKNRKQQILKQLKIKVRQQKVNMLNITK